MTTSIDFKWVHTDDLFLKKKAFIVRAGTFSLQNLINTYVLRWRAGLTQRKAGKLLDKHVQPHCKPTYRN